MSLNAKPARKFPMVWRNFERTINGQTKKFWVQDLPDEDMEVALDYFCQFFARDEPLCRSTGVLDDVASVQFFRDYWRQKFAMKSSLVCYTENDKGERKIAAMNCCFVVTKDEKEECKVTGAKAKQVFDLVDFVADIKNPFEELKIDSFLYAMGLITLPEYRGYNIGLEILESRRPLSQALGARGSVTLFTAPASQRLAEKAGFKDLVSLTNDELFEKVPHLAVPTLSKYTKSLRYMYIIYN